MPRLRLQEGVIKDTNEHIEKYLAPRNTNTQSLSGKSCWSHGDLTQIWGVDDLHEALLCLALAQRQPDGRRMRHDMPAHRLLGVRDKHGAAGGVAHDVVRDEHCHIEFLRNLHNSQWMAPTLGCVCNKGGKMPWWTCCRDRSQCSHVSA